MNCRREAMENPALFNIENLVLGARSEYNGFAGKGGFRFQCSGFSFFVLLS
ncbi:MAG: hypothetical protein PVI73_01220 [Syntrophobacterales bacterium]